MSESEAHPLEKHRRWIAAALLAFFFLAGFASLRLDSATFDETAHLPAGVTYLDRLDFRLNPEHPPLSKVWAALPLQVGRLASPDYRGLSWHGAPVDGGARSKANQWIFGYQFLNGPLSSPRRADPMRLLVPARSAMLVAAVLLGIVVWLWSSRAWGFRGGLFSLFLFCLSPTILAHSRLVTTDLPLALGYTTVLFAFWSLCSRPSVLGVVATAAALGLAMAIKFSALLLLPTLTLLAAIWIGRGRGDSAEIRRRLRWMIALGLSAVAGIFVVLWAAYGFRFDATPDPSYRLDWEVVGHRDGPAFAAIEQAIDKRLLPEAYLYGLAYFLGDAERRVAFLNGTESLTGWWYYFPEAFLIKTAPALLLLLGWLAYAGRRCFARPPFCALVPLVAVLVYVAVSIGANLNIGHRHLVPIYPLLFVSLGALVPRVLPSTRARRVLGAALLLYGVSFVVATPRYLSYFNFLAGGSKGGWRYLLDSNVDWGQDLLRLKRWVDRSGIEEIHLAYFGTADPEAYGLRYRKVAMVHDFRSGRAAVRPRSGDLLAVSANLLGGLYLDRDREMAQAMLRRGWASPADVGRYAALRDEQLERRRRYPGFGEWMVEIGRVDRDDLERLRGETLHGWIASLREGPRPVARVGDSLFIFRIP